MSAPTVFRELDHDDPDEPSELLRLVLLFDAIHRLMSFRRYGPHSSERHLSPSQYHARLASKAINVIQKLVCFLLRSCF